MTKSQAHKSITDKFNAGLISEAEARRFHRAVDQISTEIRYGHRLTRSEQSSLYAIWA